LGTGPHSSCNWFVMVDFAVRPTVMTVSGLQNPQQRLLLPPINGHLSSEPHAWYVCPN